MAKDCVGGKYVDDFEEVLDMMSMRRLMNKTEKVVSEVPQYEDLVLFPNVT